MKSDSYFGQHFLVLNRLCLVGVALGFMSLRAESADSKADRPLLAAGYAVTNVLRFHRLSGATIEWRSAPVWRTLRGWVSYSTDTHGAYFAGVGGYYGLPFADRWEFGLSFGPGYFRADHRIDLGAKVEFRSSVELSYRLRSGRRLAVGFGHISNGSIGRVNPGSEFVHLLLEMPL